MSLVLCHLLIAWASHWEKICGILESRPTMCSGQSVVKSIYCKQKATRVDLRQGARLRGYLAPLHPVPSQCAFFQQSVASIIAMVRKGPEPLLLVRMKTFELRCAAQRADRPKQRAADINGSAKLVHGDAWGVAEASARDVLLEVQPGGMRFARE